MAEDDSDFGETPTQPKAKGKQGPQGPVKAEAVDNMPFDEAVSVEDSKSVASDQELQGEGQEEPQHPAMQQKPNPRVPAVSQTLAMEDGGPKPAIPENAYNPMEYANLKVSAEITELFQYISRYQPHEIELETRLKPFIPDYIPAVGEVDAFLKVPRPDGVDEVLGLTCLVK